MNRKQQILQEIRRVAESIAPKTLTLLKFLMESSVSRMAIRYNFGTWNNALEAAGLEPNPSGLRVSGYKKYSNEALLNEIGGLWKQFGKRPNADLMNSKGKYSSKPYIKRWRTFSSAVDFYVQHFGEPKEFASNAIQPVSTRVEARSAVVIPKTFKPGAKSTDKRTVFYGEAIDFRGIRYAPINEQGVVYLFGMVSRELGFLIESIRTDYPDCEGKRYLDAAGTKLQNVRIEFEYKSSSFAEHGHDPDGCDLIVCWIHDWKECPLEVLELKSAISLLPKT
jgi:hypothetical protein